MLYRNKVTGYAFETDSVIEGENWELVEEIKSQEDEIEEEADVAKEEDTAEEKTEKKSSKKTNKK